MTADRQSAGPALPVDDPVTIVGAGPGSRQISTAIR